MAEHQIESLDDPRLVPYRQLKQSNLTRWSGRVIGEGVRVVERLLASDLSVESVFLSEPHRRRFPENLGDRCEIYSCSQSLAELVVGYRFHAGVLACAQRPGNPELWELASSETNQSVLVACPNTTDPDNLGTIIRVAAGLGAQGLLLGEGCCDPWSRRTLRVSMGNGLTLPIRECANIAADLRTLQQERGYELVASTLGAAAQPLGKWRPSGRTVLLLGNEADGLPAELVDLCDVEVTIPMSPHVDSLNVGIAAGIILHHLLGSAANGKNST